LSIFRQLHQKLAKSEQRLKTKGDKVDFLITQTEKWKYTQAGDTIIQSFEISEKKVTKVGITNKSSLVGKK